MDRLRIALLLHFYQPWWQFPWILKKIVNECYRPILRLVDEFDCFCFTININLVLLEHLYKDYPDVVEGFKKAIQSGKLELVGSTAHHPIIPLVPEFIQRAQIAEDTLKKESNFGIRRTCNGIFLPEMAFSAKDIGLLKSYGYEWTVADDEPFVAIYGKNSVPFNRVVSCQGLKVLLRSNYWSNMISNGNISFDELKSRMECEIPGWTGNVPAYLIIAMDAETFGHHHKHLIDSFLRPMLKGWAGNKISRIESLTSDFPERSVDYLPDGSWSTSVEDIRRGNPFPLWGLGGVKECRSNLWRLVNRALDHFEQAREDCLQMTSSCHWWQISRSGWEPEFMQFGAKLAMNVLRKYGPEDIASAQKDYDELMKLKKADVHKDWES